MHDTLPTEIINEILLEAIASSDPPNRQSNLTTFSLVSRAFKRTTYADPRLWTFLYVLIKPSFKEPPTHRLWDWVHQYFRRAGPILPLHLTITPQQLGEPKIPGGPEAEKIEWDDYEGMHWPDFSSMRPLACRFASLRLIRSHHGTGPISNPRSRSGLWSFTHLRSLSIDLSEPITTPDYTLTGPYYQRYSLGTFNRQRILNRESLPSLRALHVIVGMDVEGAEEGVAVEYVMSPEFYGLVRWVRNLPLQQIVRLKLTSKMGPLWLYNHSALDHFPNLEELCVDSEELGSCNNSRSGGGGGVLPPLIPPMHLNIWQWQLHPGPEELTTTHLPKLRKLSLRIAGKTLYQKTPLTTLSLPALSSLHIAIQQGTNKSHFPGYGPLTLFNLRSFAQIYRISPTGNRSGDMVVQISKLRALTLTDVEIIDDELTSLLTSLPQLESLSITSPLSLKCNLFAARFLLLSPHNNSQSMQVDTEDEDSTNTAFLPNLRNLRLRMGLSEESHLQELEEAFMAFVCARGARVRDVRGRREGVVEVHGMVSVHRVMAEWVSSSGCPFYEGSEFA